MDPQTAARVWEALAPHSVDVTDQGLDYERDEFLGFCARGFAGSYWPVAVFAVGPRPLDRLFRRRYLYHGHLVLDEEGDLVLDLFRKERGTRALESTLNPILKRLQQPAVMRPYRRRRRSPLAERLT